MTKGYIRDNEIGDYVQKRDKKINAATFKRRRFLERSDGRKEPTT